MSEAKDQDLAQARLDNLLSEHRDLDDVIARLGQDAPMDQLQLIGQYFILNISDIKMNMALVSAQIKMIRARCF